MSRNQESFMLISTTLMFVWCSISSWTLGYYQKQKNVEMNTSSPQHSWKMRQRWDHLIPVWHLHITWRVQTLKWKLQLSQIPLELDQHSPSSYLDAPGIQKNFENVYYDNALRNVHRSHMSTFIYVFSSGRQKGAGIIRTILYYARTFSLVQWTSCSV
jgi:hypothetical protein